MLTLKKISIATILAGMLVGCGGGGGSSSSPSSSSSSITLIDDFVSGVKVVYSNGSAEAYTDANGNFPYTDGSVEFYVGDVKLGTVNAVPTDGKIFLQDIIGVPRTDTTNTDVIKLGRFLQSLDSDPSTDAIEINQTNFDLFEDANDTETNLLDNGIVVDTLLGNAGISSRNIVSAIQAQNHIENILEAQGEITTSTILSLSSSTVNNGDSNVDIDADFELTFNDQIPRKYLANDYFILTNDTTNANISTEITRSQNVVTITPDADLDYGENYTLTIKNTIKSYAGTDINLGGNIDKVIAFTTQVDPNVSPTANAGADQTVTQGSSVTLDASSSSDSDGNITSYSWAEASTIISTNSSFSKSDFSVGTHNITLTVTDDDGATSTDDVTITVNATTNQAAVWNLANGTSSSAVENTASSYIIDLTGSTDADNDSLSYNWFLTPANSIGDVYNQSSTNISETTTTTIDFATADQRTNTPAPLPVGTYNLRIEQNEDRGAGTINRTAQDVTINITAASTAPLNAVITAQGISGTPFCSHTETNGNDYINFIGSTSTGNIVSWTWTDVTGSTDFTSDNTQANQTFMCTGLGAGQRTIRLTVEDSSGGTDSVEKTINILN